MCYYYFYQLFNPNSVFASNTSLITTRRTHVRTAYYEEPSVTNILWLLLTTSNLCESVLNCKEIVSAYHSYHRIILHYYLLGIQMSKVENSLNKNSHSISTYTAQV